MENSTEMELLSSAEYMDLLPHLPIEDLLLTEYKTDSEWRKLIQLRDPSKKLYHCSVCNVVQSGEKNLFAHIEGRKHKMKIGTTVQLYQPKYTYSKESIESTISLNEKDDVENSLEPSNTNESISNGNDKEETIAANTSEDVTSSADAMPQQTILEGNDDMPAVILIDDDNGSKNSLSNDDNAVDNYEPTSKKRKMVLNPAAVTTKIDDIATTKSNAPKYQSNITILPTKIKHKESAFRSENNSNAHFSTKIFSCNPRDDTVMGLVGVEYVVKILRNSNDSQPKYECGLCEFTSDGLNMQNHLVSYSHRLKFCEKHFPTAIRQYQQYIHNIPSNESYKVMTPILNKLAIAIEQHHGRELPYECHENEFNINRHEILSKVYSCRHASEQHGPTFTHIIDSKEVDKLAAELDKYQPPRNSFENISFDPRARASYKAPANDRRNVYNPHNFSRQHDNSQRNYNRYRRSKNDIIGNETHKLIADDYLKDTCKNRSSQYFNNFSLDQPNLETIPLVRHKSPSTLNENSVWKTYRHLVDQKVMGLNELFQIYKTDPETHPEYNQEWQMFWKRRKNELIEMGIDHRTFNYQPEWVQFFSKRLEELYHQAVENIKIELRRRLCLPMTNENFEIEKYFSHSEDNFGEKRVTNVMAENCPKDGNKRIVSVIRLLAALEEYLGSLGPKVVQLLSQTLQIEKNCPTSLSSIVLNEENYSLLETVKEKFKGLIIAGILDDFKQRIIRKAIDEVDYLLSNKKMDNETHTANFLEKTLEKSLNPGNKKHLLTNILTLVDKKELALKLADLLSAQGKTDVDPVQLQKIISVYMLIEEKKQQASITSNHESNQFRFGTSNSESGQTRNDGNLLEYTSYAQNCASSQPATHQNNEFFGNTSFCNSNTSYGNGLDKFSNNYRENNGTGSSSQLPPHIRQNATLNKPANWTTTSFLHSPQYKMPYQVNRKNNSYGINSNWKKF
uniref:Uncharacterized protein CG7065 n=1 Tax=Ceratitis capitata TaxID=7213 RepID=W8BHM3_CERCA